MDPSPALSAEPSSPLLASRRPSLPYLINPKVLVLQTADESCFILAPRGSEWVLLELDVANGVLSFTNAPGVDVFQPRDEMLQKLWRVSDKVHTLVDNAVDFLIWHECMAIAGLCTIASTTFVLCIQEVAEVIELPVNGGPVYRILRSEWVAITSSQASLPPPTEAQGAAMDALRCLRLDGTHFYAPASDLTAPLPYGLACNPMHPFAPEFDWNSTLRQPFRALGMEELCCSLLRGVADGAQICSFRDGAAECMQILMLHRQGNQNPNPRYQGRGLDAGGNPGNEFECELFIWWTPSASPSDVEPQQWARHMWRRGTIPVAVTYDWSGMLHWITGPKSVPATASMEDSAAYFRSLSAHLHSIVLQDTEEFPDRCQAMAPQWNLRIVDLLSRTGHGATLGEVDLSEHYETVVKKLLEDEGSQAKVNMSYRHFDWNEMMKAMGVRRTVEQMWRSVPLGSTKDHSLITCGVLYPDLHGLPRIAVTTVQSDFLRINCADSLDRTNLFSFFWVLRILTRMQQQLHFQFRPEEPNPVKEHDSCAICTSFCPSRGDLRPTYSNHQISQSGEQTFLQLITSPSPQLLHALCGMFVNSGDIIAEVFAGSAALHSDAIRDLCPELPSASCNAWIAVQRRLSNAFLDEERRVQANLLLGRHRCQLGATAAA